MTTKKILFSSIIIFSIILLDQLSKALVLRFGVSHACNTGFAFGIFQGILNGLIAVLVLLVVIYSLTREQKPIVWLGLALVIGGGTSNVLDRVLRGCVIDFIKWLSQTWLPLPGWLQSSLTRWPAFNFADMAISVGVGILILSLIKGSKPASHHIL